MAPKKEVEILNLEEFKLNPIRINHRRTQIESGVSVFEKQKQLTLITVYHWVVHLLAFLIIVPYVALILTNNSVPESYSTIVSVVIGFYFAKSLFKS